MGAVPSVAPNPQLLTLQTTSQQLKNEELSLVRLLTGSNHQSSSETEDMEPSGAVWLDDCCNLWIGNEVGQVGDVPNDGEGVLGVDPVHHLLLLLNIAREEQARHTAGSQTTPVWFLWQLTQGLLSSPVFTSKGCRRRRQPCRGQCRCSQVPRPSCEVGEPE